MSEPNVKRKSVYGIDLGTTYSAIAFVDEYGKAEIIPNSDNERITPSAVFFDSPQNIVVGKIARESAKTDPERVVEFVKRQIGTDWSFPFEGVDYRAEELSSYIVKRLVEDVKKTKELDVKDVVITCPAYFGDAERAATRQAGELAGLNVLQILDEPASAALYYGLNERDSKKNAIVYDLGGGTFDVSIVSIDRNEVRIVCADGDHRLGGKDWDDRIAEFAAAAFQEETANVDLLGDPEACYDLRYNAEEAKKTLTVRDKAKIRVSSGGERVAVELTRKKFEELTQDLLERTIELTRSAIEFAKTKGVEKIDEFLLVGGSTRMPMIARRVSEAFAAELGCEPKAFEVDEAVAKGAALFGQAEHIKIVLAEKAEEIAGKAFDELSTEEQNAVVDAVGADEGLTSDYLLESANVSITTVATKSYGIRAKKNGVPLVRHLILRQSPTPTSGTQVFFTEDADATEIEFRVFSDNSPEQDAELESAAEIGTAKLEIPLGLNLPARSPISVTFSLSSEGVLEMTAVEQKSNAKIEAKFQAEVGMSADELAQAQKRVSDVLVE